MSRLQPMPGNKIQLVRTDRILWMFRKNDIHSFTCPCTTNAGRITLLATIKLAHPAEPYL